VVFSYDKKTLYMRSRCVQDKGDRPLDLFGGIAGDSAMALLAGDTQKSDAGLVGFDDGEVTLDGWAGYMFHFVRFPFSLST
jgi:hypothetical protein